MREVSSGSPEQDIFKLDVPAGDLVIGWSGCEVSLVLFLPVSDSQGVQVAQGGEKLPENMEAFRFVGLSLIVFLCVDDNWWQFGPS